MPGFAKALHAFDDTQSDPRMLILNLASVSACSQPRAYTSATAE